MEKMSFESGVEVRRSDGWRQWVMDGDNVSYHSTKDCVNVITEDYMAVVTYNMIENK